MHCQHGHAGLMSITSTPTMPALTQGLSASLNTGEGANAMTQGCMTLGMLAKVQSCVDSILNFVGIG